MGAGLAAFAALAALAALALALASTSSVAVPTVTGAHSPRAAAPADHVAVVGVIDARTSAGLVNLFALFGAGLLLFAAWSWSASGCPPPTPSTTHGLRRWWARLVGAPPVLS